MFDQLFRNPHLLACQRNGPLPEERLRYLAHCANQQMAQESLRKIAQCMLIIAKVLRLQERPGERITATEIHAEVDRWANRPKPSEKGGSLLTLRCHAIRWLEFLGRLQPPPTTPWPHSDQLAQFTEYLQREHGLSPQTIAYSGRTMRGFLQQIAEAELRLSTLTVAQVNDLLAQKVHGHSYARSTIHRWASVLRPFFRFAEERQWCRPGLADGLWVPRRYQQEGLPVGLSWDDVKRLLAAAAGDGPTDIRDRALVMLLAVYGLRAGEVVGLRLENFDWEREMLTVVHGKGYQPRRYPLCRPVGDAVLRYLREVRPRSDRREVFLTLRAPVRSLSAKALGRAIRVRLHALGVSLPHYGPHVLRHTCATHLLAQGLSLKEIGDHLGHRSSEATRIYAKVDLATLRTVGDFNLEDVL